MYVDFRFGVILGSHDAASRPVLSGLVQVTSAGAAPRMRVTRPAPSRVKVLVNADAPSATLLTSQRVPTFVQTVTVFVSSVREICVLAALATTVQPLAIRPSCPTRFAATFTFYREGLGTATGRLRNWLEQSGGGILDEPATARALADFLVRGVWCGAVTEPEATGATGLTLDQLRQLARPTR